ncbi:hypothetical protein JG688_00015304 [Phytophthora aleatoria]|uniref:Neutral zinc metallopeptidase n=1 Tax=Phytophthora aleatoria TaxID=2496075 RepID=A0A8J5IZM6_9STRA|nr:hypothetical protein JG688_00015304 [Phytophthora aleatoria]
MTPSLLSSFAAVVVATTLAFATTEAASTNSSASHAPFETITSKPGECVVGSPNTYVSAEDLANKKLTKEIAAKLQPMLTRQHTAWNRWIIGYDCWPYYDIKVNVVGIAVKDKSVLGWSDDSLGKIYVGDLDKDGSPQCPENCYRAADSYSGKWSESSGCDGKPFDISLWPTQDLGGGWGTYWGQQVDLDNMLLYLNENELEIVSHEMGHGFGLPDFDQQPKPDNFKPYIMDAMPSSTVRDTDGWLLCRVLENKKHNYDF